MKKPFPPTIQTPNFYTADSADSQPRFNDPKPTHHNYINYKKAPLTSNHWHSKPTVIHTEAETNALRAQIINHPEFDNQMNAMIKLLGKEIAEAFLAKVLENQSNSFR